MRVAHFAVMAMLGLTTASGMAVAQSAPATTVPSSEAPGMVSKGGPPSTRASNITPDNTRSNVAPSLPASPVGDNAEIQDYLRAARSSLAAGRTGEAQQSLEMAETRALTRSTDASQASTPDSNPMVIRIRDALHALGTGNRTQALELIDGGLMN